MKTLLILRHGKAEDTNPGGDRKRNLAPRGQRDATRIGQELVERKAVPDLVVSSDAARAHQTAELAAEASGYDGEIMIRAAIYDDGIDGVMGVIKELPATAERVLLVGHNPTFETLVHELTEAELTLPTAGLACVELDIRTWTSARMGSGKLLWHVWPKELS